MLNVNSGKLFPFQFRLLGLVFIIIGCFTVLLAPFVAPVLLLLGILMVLAFSGVEFDRQNKKYRVYNSFLFFKTGKWEPYEDVTSLYVNASKTNQKIYTMVTTGITAFNNEYNAYLSLGEGDNIFLLSSRKKDALLKRIKPVSEYFNIKVEDYSSR